MTMSRPMDPFSGSYSMTSQDRIPAWEKGSKLAHWDSSDLSGISSSSSEEDSSFDESFRTGDASYVVDSDGEMNGASPGTKTELIRETEMTPRAAKQHLHRASVSSGKSGKSASSDKGKGKAKNQDQDSSDVAGQAEAISPQSAGRAHASSARSRPRRPRSHSNTSSVASPPILASLSPPSSSASADNAYRVTSKRAPGPAAQAMADFMSNSNKPSTSRSNPAPVLSSSGFQGLMPASALAPSSSKLGARPLSRPAHLVNSSRQLGRATSAPNNLFAESLPTNNLFFSPSGSTLSRTEEEADVYPASPSPEADMQTILNKAYEARSGSIDLSRKNLVRIPANVSDLSHYVTLDVRTDKSRPTPIFLNLDSNYLNAAGLPSSLFSITNLEILSLRANQIESLPQSIGNLTGLRQLNLFNNKLTYLPAEILELKLEKLQLGSNRFPAYQKPEVMAKEDEKEANKSQAEEEAKVDTAIRRVLEPRKSQFRVPSLVELCTRRLLEPVDGSRESGSPALSKSRSKLFTPGMANTSSGNVRRHFHTVKDNIMEHAPVPPHLLKPFLSLLQPLPHHLRCLLTPDESPSASPNDRILGTPSSSLSKMRLSGTPSQPSLQAPFEAVKDIPQCSVCKTPCSQFAETRIEWRSEIAGVSLGKSDDERCWVPVLWRGCSANCLDFLDEEVSK